MTYQPRKNTKIILDKTKEIMDELSYTPSLRYLFYRIWQEYSQLFDLKKIDPKEKKKKAYGKFVNYLSKGRKCFYDGWHPASLKDDKRPVFRYGGGYDDEQDFARSVINKFHCSLAKHHHQDYYVEVWFEAYAMLEQFAAYTRYIPLRPFSGDASIPFKWDIAKGLEKAAERYDKPIVILYFGDLDPKGLEIPENALKDVREWCDADFDFYRIGLNSGHEIEYDLTDNPEKPGTYQWEALPDNDNKPYARNMIKNAVAEFIDESRYAAIEEEGSRISQRARAALASEFGDIL